MKPVITGMLLLLFGVTVPAFAQEEHHEEGAKPAQHEEQAKPAAKQEQAKPQEKEQQAKPTKQEQAKPEKQQQVSYFVGVPLNNIFEHLEATIGEATPLYELCASVLQPASE